MIQNLQNAELNELLKQLKSYKDLKHKLWDRWVKLFKNSISNKKDFVVEYAMDLDESFVIDKALEIYRDIFLQNIEKNEIILTQNNELIWWIRIFFEDKMLDLSFLKYLKNLQK